MASLAPVPEHLKQMRIHPRETALRAHGRVVVRPPSNVRIQVFYQDLLWECHLSHDLFLESFLMPFHGRLTLGDTLLKSQSSSFPVLTLQSSSYTAFLN